MRILILGGNGMLGHKLVQAWRERFEVWATLRSNSARHMNLEIFDSCRILTGTSAENFDSIVKAFGEARPDVAVNCIGVIKQVKTADAVTMLSINAIFPHRLADLCRAAGVRLITLSTDCVFSGGRGNYAEADSPDAQDLYGQSKRWGEVDGTENCLTVRTSIIGRELTGARSLVEWFLANRGGRVKGFTNAIYTGFPTIVMADILADVIENYPNLSGIRHVSSRPVSKYELLQLIRRAYAVDIEIEPFDDFQIDRSLDSSRFRAETDFVPLDWSEMVERMAADPTPYDEWRKIR